MKILYISQYFPPEMGAPAARVHELSRAWVARGHAVTVLTAFPHHPSGVIPPAYRGFRYLRETVDGIDVLRTWVYATANKGFARRTLSYVSFMLSAVLIGLPGLLARRYDVVIATSPQFFVAVAGWVISTILRRPFVFEVRDIWPASIEAVGAISNKKAIAFLEKIEMTLYRRARLVVAVADSTVDILSRRGVPAGKIAVVKNGVDLAKFRPLARDNSVRTQYGLGAKFVCSYIGTIGLAHGLDIILDAADRTKSDDALVYLVVGEGARRRELQDAAAARGLRNVIFTGETPRDRVPEFLAASDAVLVHLRKAELFEAVIPSKIFEIMAAARPVIMGVGGEAGEIIRTANAGVLIEPENTDEFLEALRVLRNDPAAAQAMGRRGRAFVEANFDRQVLAEKYLQLLEKTALVPRDSHVAVDT